MCIYFPVSDFCQSEIKFGVQWPRTKTGEEITVECSLADSIFTGIIKLHVLIELYHSPLALYLVFAFLLHCQHPFFRMYSKLYYVFGPYYSTNVNVIINIIVVGSLFWPTWLTVELDFFSFFGFLHIQRRDQIEYRSDDVIKWNLWNYGIC